MDYLFKVRLLFSLLLLAIPSYAQVKEWKQLPLRSIEQKTAGLMGGEGMQIITGIAYAPSNPQIVYLASNTSQIWKSTCGGNSWRMKHEGFFANGGLSLAVDPRNEQVVLVAGYVGREKKESDKNTATGIFRTLDGGNSWQLIKKIDYFGNFEGEHFAFDSSSFDKRRSQVIYAGTYRDGLLKSTDGGENWTHVALEGVRISDIKIDPQNPSTVYLATRKGFYRYDDKQKKTNKIGQGLPDFPRTMAQNPKSPNILYVTVGKYGVYQSVDGGNSFKSKNRGLWIAGKEYIHISISPANPEYLYVSVNRWGGLNPFWSHDGGATWHRPKTLDKGDLSLAGNSRYFSGYIEPHPTDSNIALTSANGAARVLITNDGGINWSYSGNGYTGGRRGRGKSSLAFHHDPKKMIFFLTDFGPVLTEDGGESFRLLAVPRTLNGKTTPVGAVDPTGNSRIIVTAVGGWKQQLLTVSADEGKTWQVIPGTEDNYKFIGFHPQKSDVIYAQGWKSEDRAKTWRRLPKKVYAICQQDGEIVYSIESSGKGASFVFKSIDGGRTWSSPYASLPVSASVINEIDVDPVNPDRIYVATNRGVYIHINGDWIRKGKKDGLTADRFGLFAVKCVVVDPHHPEVVYAGRWAPGVGQSHGIFRSTDSGETWENITYNLGPEISCWSISVSPYNGMVYFGSSHGTWVLGPPY
jgi:photosystem II stability/assembly factor-like uncharacterized protein